MVFGGCDFAQRFVDVSRKESQSFHAKMRKVLNLWRKVFRKESQRFIAKIHKVLNLWKFVKFVVKIFTQRIAKLFKER